MEESEVNQQSGEFDIPEHFRKRLRNVKLALVVFVMLTIALVLFVLSIVYFNPINRADSGRGEAPVTGNGDIPEDSMGYSSGYGRHDGIYYEVQIGAFKDFNLEKYNENLVNLRIEKEGGVFKYSLGRFRDYREALFFENDLKRMGFSDAFIIARENGIRVDLDSLLQSIGY